MPSDLTHFQNFQLWVATNLLPGRPLGTLMKTFLGDFLTGMAISLGFGGWLCFLLFYPG